MSSAKPASLYFAIVFGAGFVLGAIRVTLLIPRIGVRAAELAEMPIMLAVIVLAAHTVVRRFSLPARTRTRLAVGLFALALLVAAELVLAITVQSQSLSEYIAGRDPVSGSVYLGMLVVFAIMPLLVRRERN